MYEAVHQAQAQSKSFLGKWSYAVPFVFFVGFVIIEVVVLKLSGHWDAVAAELVVCLAGLLALIFIFGAFFLALFNRLENLFRDLTLMHLWTRESEAHDVENKHFQISLQLQNRSEITERMKHYYPLALVILLIAIEVVFLEANGYMHLVREKLAKYAFFGATFLAFSTCLFFAAFMRIEGLWDDLREIGEQSLKEVEQLVAKMQKKLKANLAECKKGCRESACF